MTLIKKGDFIVENPDTVSSTSSDTADKNSDISQSSIERDNPEGMSDGSGGGNIISRRSLDGKPGNSTKEYKTTLGSGGNKAEVSSSWESAKNKALGSFGGSLSEKARRIIEALTKNKPKVNWEKELKKFLNSATSRYDYTLPNKRTLASGSVTYGRKKSGDGSIKTLVLPVDTSASISKAQIKVFVEEVLRLSTQMEIEKTIIIYCSDDIDSVDIVDKGKKPDFSKISSTGGNAKGFKPPFQWIKDNKINPTAVIYLSDTQASFPSASDYGIAKYKNRVFWFICVEGSNYNEPPFGKKIHVPMDQKGNFM
jgi:predicted metal-dependent peptidase